MRRRTRAAVIGVPVLLGVAAVAMGAAGFVPWGGRHAPGPADPMPSVTAPITRMTLTQTETVSGTLGYGATRMVRPPDGGTITWLPPVRTVIGRGQPIYRIDNKPVPLLFGGLPFYRQLAPGNTGPDVRELERNLAALGYTGFTVDGAYTPATASAVSAWQEGLGVPQTGVFDPASVVLAPGKVRIASLAAQPGDHASGPVLTYTGTTRTVHVDLDVALQQLVRPGTSATVRLPAGATLPGTVTGIGSVISAHGNQPATIGVTVAVRDQSVLGPLDQAPVTVNLISATERDVLTVPVAALVALAEGGYGVQVVAGPASRHVPVRLGMFAGGRVEISGAGLTAGTRVGVAAP